jgi:uncharacterized protein YoxC
MSAFEIARIIMFIALSISVLAISLQLVRLFGEIGGIMKDSRKTLKKVNKMLEHIEDDYEDLRDKLFDIVNLLEVMVPTFTGVIGVRKIVSILQSLLNVKDKKRSYGGKSKKNK